jgi:biotin carboxylase
MNEHILVIHRWRDRYARYEDYVDHHADRVTYVTTTLARPAIPSSAVEVVTVSATDDFAEVCKAADALVERFGVPARVIALNEGDLDTAAMLRAYLGCPGQDPTQLARFRDKLTMVQLVAAAGIRTPAFADAPDADAVREFVGQHGWPVVVKPRRGTASRGVVRLDSADDLVRLSDLPAEPRLVQRFCADPIYHVDGLWTGTQLGPWRASRYLNTCVDFTTGAALGSVEVDDETLLDYLAEFAAAVAGALSDEPWVFHMELFVGSVANAPPQLTFLEVGYRVGGAEIPFVWREVHGVDLMAAAIDVQLGRQPAIASPSSWRTGGWLLVPTPVRAPCRVVAAKLELGPDEGPYASVIPPIGYLIPRVGGYEHVGARFRFQGARTDDVEKAIVTTASRFRLDCVAEQ